ncbi:hypothetical protein CRENBAI_009271 [Crenichthys baileyi]|uniref:Uncharacterized protein n=1 Tax=Crenichthys baileyi TaxID=28760 RepID=A0AAV9R7T5_9TELE
MRLSQPGTCTRANQPPQAELPQRRYKMHSTASPNYDHKPASGRGQDPQEKASEEGHHSAPKTGHPTNPTTKPQAPHQVGRTHTRTGYPCCTELEIKLCQ